MESDEIEEVLEAVIDRADDPYDIPSIEDWRTLEGSFSTELPNRSKISRQF